MHAHTALFGVYGMLGVGLMLFTLRIADLRRVWNERALSVAYWSFNAGLVLMVALSLLPVGIKQTIASVDHGMWYARSAEFLGQPILASLRWWRTPGDIVFSVGALAIGWFVFGLARPGVSRPTPRDMPAAERADEIEVVETC